MQKLAGLITVVVTGGFTLWWAGPRVSQLLRTIYSPGYNEKSGVRGGLAAAVGLFLALGVTIWGAVSGWRMNGFFGALEIFLLLWVAFGCVMEVVFRIHHIYRWLRRTPPRRIVLAALFLPVCLLTGYLAGRFAGFPLYMAVEDWLDKATVGRTYSSAQWYDMCMFMSLASSVISWGVFASRSALLRNWLKLLLGVALIAIAACFVPLGVGGLLVWLLLAKIVWPLINRCCRIYYAAYDATPHNLSEQTRKEIAAAVASDPLVFLFAKVKNKDDDE